MLTAMVTLFALNALLFGAVLLMQRHVVNRLDTLSDAVVRLQRQAPDSPVSRLTAGRAAPTADELNQARNRMDALGVAHPGGWQRPPDPDRPAA